MFTHDKITNIEIDVIDACGLKCPVCSRNSKTTLMNLKGTKKYISLEDNIKIFDRFKNVESVVFIGTRSESTLYPFLLELITYLKSRKIKIVISTNGNSKNSSWWGKLGLLLTEDDEVRFAIDGSTQEIYSHYRKGGNLEKLLKNYNSFKNTTNCIKTLQFIQFKYNYKDLDNIRKMKTEYNFDKLFLVHGSYTLDGRQNAKSEEFVDGNFEIKDYYPPAKILKKYKLIESAFIGKKKVSIECTSYKNNEIFINHFGQYSICCFHNGELLRTGSKGGDMNFINDEHNNKVKQNKYSFCLTNCNQICKSLLTDIQED